MPRNGNTDADAVVIGAGFFGCHVALRLRQMGMPRVILVDSEAGLLRRASYVNQARVHNGYHYPRSLCTAISSRRNFARFCAEYSFAVRAGFEQIYAIARHSRVSATQFAAFCAEVGAPCRESSGHLRRLFDTGLIDNVFITQEAAFDATALARDLLFRLRDAGIEPCLNTEAKILSSDARGGTVRLGAETSRVAWVFNCTYAGLDAAGVRLRSSLKKELAEIVLIKPPLILANLGVTVMDGPFFTTMPFPARGCHSLSHVRYTPHGAWTDPSEAPVHTRSQADAMLRDGARYLPALAHAEVLGSLYEVKVLLSRTEDDDARPILFEKAAESSRVISILGGKIDNVYDVLEVLRLHDWSDERAPLLGSVSAVTIIDDSAPDAAAFALWGDTLAALFADVELVIVANGVSSAVALELDALAADIPDLTIHFLAARIDHDTAHLVGLDCALGDWVLLAEPRSERLPVVRALVERGREGYHVAIAIGEAPDPGGLLRGWFAAGYFRLYQTLTGRHILHPPPTLRLYSRAAALFIAGSPEGEVLLKCNSIAGGLPTFVSRFPEFAPMCHGV